MSNSKKLCVNCNIQMNDLVFRPSIGRRTQYIVVGKICKECKNYEMNIRKPKTVEAESNRITKLSERCDK